MAEYLTCVGWGQRTLGARQRNGVSAHSPLDHWGRTMLLSVPGRAATLPAPSMERRSVDISLIICIEHLFSLIGDTDTRVVLDVCMTLPRKPLRRRVLPSMVAGAIRW